MDESQPGASARPLHVLVGRSASIRRSSFSCAADISTSSAGGASRPGPAGGGAAAAGAALAQEKDFANPTPGGLANLSGFMGSVHGRSWVAEARPNP